MSIAHCGQCSAPSHHCMLTDDPPQPHLPYMEQGGCTQGRRQDGGQMNGMGTKSLTKWSSALHPLPSSLLHSSACIEVPQCWAVVPEIHTSLGFLSFTKREEGGLWCSVLQHSAEAEGLAVGNEHWSNCSMLPLQVFVSICQQSPWKVLSSCSNSVSASVPAADESCTCCAYREQAQEHSPPPPPSLSPSLLFTPSSSLDGPLSPFLYKISIVGPPWILASGHLCATTPHLLPPCMKRVLSGGTWCNSFLSYWTPALLTVSC